MMETAGSCAACRVPCRVCRVEYGVYCRKYLVIRETESDVPVGLAARHGFYTAICVTTRNTCE